MPPPQGQITAELELLRLFKLNDVDDLIGRTIRLSFDPAGYEEFLSRHGLNLGTDYTYSAKLPHISVGTVIGFDFHHITRNVDISLTLYTTIQSIAGIRITTVEWWKDGDGDGRWVARFRLFVGNGYQEETVPLTFRDC